MVFLASLDAGVVCGPPIKYYTKYSFIMRVFLSFYFFHALFVRSLACGVVVRRVRFRALVVCCACFL